MLSNDYNTKHITSGKKYKVVFELFVTANTYSALSYSFKYVDDVWSTGTEINDKLSSLTVENKTTSGSFTVYKMSKGLTEAKISEYCYLSINN